MTETVQQALAKVMGSIGAVGKTDENSAQNYKFRGIDTVMAAVKPALVEHGVVFVPNVTNADAQELLIGKNQTRMRHVMLTVRFDIYGPAGDHIEATTVGEAMDSGDKSTNKALSAAFKYALMQVLCISDAGADDSDHESPQFGEAAPLTYNLAQAKGAVVEALKERGFLTPDAKSVAAELWGSHGPAGDGPFVDADLSAVLEQAAKAENPAERPFE